MSLSLHKIKPSANSQETRKRVGRGNGSGIGTYSGRGLKGQKSRSGVSNLKRLGMRQVLLRTPKKRGFRSLNPKNQVVNLQAINELFKDGETVNAASLFAKKLITTPKQRIKILGQGELRISSLKFENVTVSESAKVQIEKKKGKIA